MLRTHRVLLMTTLCLILGCQAKPAPREKMLPPPRLDAFGRPLPPYLNPSTTPPLIIKSSEMPSADASSDANWQPLDSTSGELDHGSSTLNFSPRSARWRFSLTSERTAEAEVRPNQDRSYVKVSLWIGDKDPQGKIGLRAVAVNFKRKGGATCVQEFDYGLWPDGSPRPFQITISGTYVTFQAKVEDHGPTIPTPIKPGRSGE